MTETKTNYTNQLQIGPSEQMFLLGLVLLFVGLWLWLGLGQALTTVGIVLVIGALINGYLRWRSDVV